MSNKTSTPYLGVLTEKNALKQKLGSYYHPKKDHYRDGLCPVGTIPREGYEYIKKNGKVVNVKTSCVKDVGSNGKTSTELAEKLKVNPKELEKYGYSTKNKVMDRHSALIRAINEISFATTKRILVLLRTQHKAMETDKTKKIYQIYDTDIKWLTNYVEKERKKNNNKDLFKKSVKKNGIMMGGDNSNGSTITSNGNNNNSKKMGLLNESTNTSNRSTITSNGSTITSYGSNNNSNGSTITSYGNNSTSYETNNNLNGSYNNSNNDTGKNVLSAGAGAYNYSRERDYDIVTNSNKLTQQRSNAVLKTIQNAVNAKPNILNLPPLNSPNNRVERNYVKSVIKLSRNVPNGQSIIRNGNGNVALTKTPQGFNATFTDGVKIPFQIKGPNQAQPNQPNQDQPNQAQPNQPNQDQPNQAQPNQPNQAQPVSP